MYSHAVRVGDMLYVSGQAAFDERGRLVGEGSMTEQAEHVFRCLGEILADQGAGFGDIAFLRTYLTDMDDRVEYGQVRRKYITGTPRPARPWRCRSCSCRGCCWRWTRSSRCRPNPAGR
ncbi:RidA family protein [Nonomuraea ferruginea]